MIRPACLQDLDTLVEIENACFDVDRLSRRNFRHTLTKGNADTLIFEDEEGVHGYVMVLYTHGTSLARIYSLAVNATSRGKGVGKALIEAAEQGAIDHERLNVRLEIRPDNAASINLFTKMGYRQFGLYHDYYEDHMDALRLEKRLTTAPAPVLAKVPYYEQTLEFTCGPAALMMAMRALDSSFKLDRYLELRLWRESTSIFMTSGHGGCGPFGLGLSACHRGFEVEIYVNDEGALFVDSVRSEEKKEVIRLVQEDFLAEIKTLPIKLEFRMLGLEEMKKKFDEGGIPVILISSYRIYREKFPHWVVVTGYDDRFIFFHDPFVDYEKSKTMTDCVDMPISQKDFERMSRYGKSEQRAALIIYNRGKKRNKSL